jgi:hypothetical protein
MFRFPTGEENFSLVHLVPTGSGAHISSYRMGTGALSQGIKGQGVKLTTHLLLVPRGAIPPPPDKS